jgi:hypothetical protein
MSTRSKVQKVPVTERALMKRINRSLAKRAVPEMLMKNRPRRGSYGAVGEFYIVDMKRRSLSRTNVDLVAVALEEHVLEEWEELVR